MSQVPTPSDPGPDPDAEVLADQLAGAAQLIVARLVPDSQGRSEQLGEVFLVCEQIAKEQPEAIRGALSKEALAGFLMPHVRARLGTERPETFRGGWLGTYVGPDGRDIERPDEEEDSTDRAALEHSGQALQRAFSLAHAEGNRTLERNLRWYRLRLEHTSYAAIARREQKLPGTVRTGVVRARRFLLSVVHELRHAQPAPLSGEAPSKIEPLRRLWERQDLESLSSALERTREAHADDPHWLNLAGLLAADRGQQSEAARLYEQALVVADAPSVRGRVLNNLGNLADDQARHESARQYWLRANQLLPDAPAPILNLLAAASCRRDYPSAQHHLNQLAALFCSDKLSEAEVAYAKRRLRENDRFDWLRDTDAWRQGPARWTRGARASQGPRNGAAALMLLAALILAPLLASPAPGGLPPGDFATSPHAHSPADLPRLAAQARKAAGGDSMGKKGTPRPAQTRLSARAGDSMGKRPTPPPRRPA